MLNNGTVFNVSTTFVHKSACIQKPLPLLPPSNSPSAPARGGGGSCLACPGSARVASVFPSGASVCLSVRLSRAVAVCFTSLSCVSPWRQTADITVYSALMNGWRSSSFFLFCFVFAIPNSPAQNILGHVSWFRCLCISAKNVLRSRTAEWRECRGPNLLDSITFPNGGSDLNFTRN